MVKKVELDTFLRRLAIGGPGDRPYAPLELAYWFHFLWLRALLCPLPAESALAPVALRLTYSTQPYLRVTVAHTGGGGSQDTWWLHYALDRQRIQQAPAALRGLARSDGTLWHAHFPAQYPVHLQQDGAALDAFFGDGAWVDEELGALKALQPRHGQVRVSTGQTLPIPLDQYLVPAGPEHAEGGAPPAGRTADDEATRRVLAQLEQLAERYSAAYSAANEQVRTSVRTILDVLADMQAKMPQGSASFEAAVILMAEQERLELVDREARRDFVPPPTLYPEDQATHEALRMAMERAQELYHTTLHDARRDASHWLKSLQGVCAILGHAFAADGPNGSVRCTYCLAEQEAANGTGAGEARSGGKETWIN